MVSHCCDPATTVRYYYRDGTYASWIAVCPVGCGPAIPVHGMQPESADRTLGSHF